MNKENTRYFICVLIGIVFGLMLGYKITPAKTKIKEVYITTPVERIKYDTFYKVRDSIIYKTKYIREIQHDTIEKIYATDDSCALKLFFELVSE